MSIKLMSLIWEAGPPQQGDRFVLLAIADHANDEGEAFPGVAGLAQKTCMTTRGVQKILRRLEAGGWLVTDKRQGRYHCNLYTVLTPNVVHPSTDAVTLNVVPSDPERSSLDPEHGSPKPSLTVIRNTTPEALPEVENIYEAYPRKVEKVRALKAIQKALKKTSPGELLLAVQEFAAAMKLWPKEDRHFIPYPATWFNRERWKDDRQEWIRRPKIGLTEPHQPAISFA